MLPTKLTKDSKMSQSYDAYTNLANEFISKIRKQSPAAAECIEQIRAQYGAQPAYLAAFALVMLAQRLNQTGYASLGEALKSFTFYEEMKDTAEAIRLYEDAAEHLLRN